AREVHALTVGFRHGGASSRANALWPEGGDLLPRARDARLEGLPLLALEILRLESLSRRDTHLFESGPQGLLRRLDRAELEDEIELVEEAWRPAHRVRGQRLREFDQACRGRRPLSEECRKRLHLVFRLDLLDVSKIRRVEELRAHDREGELRLGPDH